MDPASVAMMYAYVQQYAAAMGVDPTTAMTLLYAQQQQQQQQQPQQPQPFSTTPVTITPPTPAPAPVAVPASAPAPAPLPPPPPPKQQQAEARPTKASGLLEVWGNTHTMNIENRVLTNIFASDYYKGRLSYAFADSFYFLSFVFSQHTPLQGDPDMVRGRPRGGAQRDVPCAMGCRNISMQQGIYSNVPALQALHAPSNRTPVQTDANAPCSCCSCHGPSLPSSVW